MQASGAPKRQACSHDWTNRVLSIVLLGSLLFSSTASAHAAGALDDDASVPWMVEDQQSAANHYRAQDDDGRQPQARLPRPEANTPRFVNTDNQPIEQWAGGRHNQAFSANPSLRKPDRFADNPETDSAGVRHFSNGKHFDLSKMSIDQAVDTANSSTLSNKPFAPDAGNRPRHGNQFNSRVASSLADPTWAGTYGGKGITNFDNGNFGNNQGGNFGNNQGGNFGRNRGGNGQGRMSMSQRRRLHEARRLARLIRQF